MGRSHLLVQMREVIRLHHYRTRSEEVYSRRVIDAHSAPYNPASYSRSRFPLSRE